MPNVFCPDSLNCPSADGLNNDWPIQNWTSEAADVPFFIGNNPVVNPDPPIGKYWTHSSCKGNCFSTISQADADLCAHNNELLCVVDPGPGPPTPPQRPGPNNPINPFPTTGGTHGGDDGGNPPPTCQTDPSLCVVTLYKNTIQSCTVYCPDGTPFTAIQAKNTVSASSQELANRQAQSMACAAAKAQMVCFPPPRLACLNNELKYNSPNAINYVLTGQWYFYCSWLWSIDVGSIPPGLNIDATGVMNANGVLEPAAVFSGTPTTPGLYQYVLVARCATLGGLVEMGRFKDSIAVMGITNTTLPDGIVGTPYSQQLMTDGTRGTVTFSVDPATLPPGFTMDLNGLITGTPVVDASYLLSVQLMDSKLGVCDYKISLTINAFVCNWSTKVLPHISDPGGCAPSLEPAWDGLFTNVIDYTPGKPMWYFVGQSVLGLQVAADEFTGPPAYPIPGWAAAFDGFQIYWTGGGWQMWFNGANGGNEFWIGNGTSVDIADPSGVYTYVGGSNSSIQTITVQKAGLKYCVSDCTISCITDTSPLPNANQGSAYSYNFATSSHLCQPFPGPNPIWSITAGALPTGLLLSSLGNLAGTPTVSGTFNFTVQIICGLDICTKDFALTVNPVAPFTLGLWAKQFPPGTLNNAGNPATITGAVAFQGITVQADLVVNWATVDLRITTGGTSTFDVGLFADWFNYGNSASGPQAIDVGVSTYAAGHYQLTVSGEWIGSCTFTLVTVP